MIKTKIKDGVKTVSKKDVIGGKKYTAFKATGPTGKKMSMTSISNKNGVMAKTGDDGRAIREANAVVRRRKK